MADNYLEKQYETYAARKAAWERERKYGKKRSVKPSKSEEKLKEESSAPAPPVEE